MLKINEADLLAVKVVHENDTCGDYTNTRLLDDDNRLAEFGSRGTVQTFGGTYGLYSNWVNETVYITAQNGGSGITIFDSITGGTLAAREYVGINLIRDYWISDLLENEG